MENNEAIILGEITIQPLLNARKRFETFRRSLESEQEQAGAVQAYEYCFELCWKMLKRVLKLKGIDVASPRDAFREGAQNQFIDDPEQWFSFLRMRNIALHTYNEANMQQVIAIFPSFSIAMMALIDAMLQLNDSA